MDNNDYYRRIRYALQLDDAKTLDLLSLADWDTNLEQVAAWRTKETEPGFQACPADAVSALLDGLIIDRRGPPPAGKQPDAPRQASGTGQGVLDNNTVLKQLRIALSLRTDDVQELVNKGGGQLGKTEVNALFRNTSARNYRRCGDQLIRWFLAGLASARDDAGQKKSP